LNPFPSFTALAPPRPVFVGSPVCAMKLATHRVNSFSS
jgi:hypothetical protein